MKNKIGKKENKLTYNGVKYKAVHTSGLCGGCVFKSVVCPKVGVESESYCTDDVRKDGKNIIWVKINKD